MTCEHSWNMSICLYINTYDNFTRCYLIQSSQKDTHTIDEYFFRNWRITEDEVLRIISLLIMGKYWVQFLLTMSPFMFFRVKAYFVWFYMLQWWSSFVILEEHIVKILSWVSEESLDSWIIIELFKSMETLRDKLNLFCFLVFFWDRSYIW